MSNVFIYVFAPQENALFFTGCPKNVLLFFLVPKDNFNKKRYFYVCDLGLLGSGRKMKQTTLSLHTVKTTNSEDDTILGLRESYRKQTATEGQKQRCETVR